MPNKQGLHVEQPDLDDLAKKYGVPREHIDYILQVAQKSMEPVAKRIAVTEMGKTQYYQVVRKGAGPLITPYGNLWQFDFEIDDIWGKYSAIVAGQIDFETLQPRFANTDHVIVRTDSGCETGQVFHDLTCDCREQLHLAMRTIAEKGEGIIVNIPAQEGRGMGLPFKLATLFLQEQLGVNTVESAGILAPGGIIDVRTYSGVIGILKFFGIQPGTKIDLATNNPYKEAVFVDNDYEVNGNIPMIIDPTEHTARHIQAKGQFCIGMVYLDIVK